jgi:hypothetical protein
MALPWRYDSHLPVRSKINAASRILTVGGFAARCVQLLRNIFVQMLARSASMLAHKVHISFVL